MPATVAIWALVIACIQARLAIVPAQTRIAMWSRYIAGEYGGMNEVLARLYRLTGEKRFLEWAKLRALHVTVECGVAITGG